MAFPETRMTLIHRIATGDDHIAWKQFMSDYWRPMCLFSKRIGNLRWEDAEDVASQTLEVLGRQELLQKWLSDPRVRFKTLVCSVVRNLTMNRARSDRARSRRLQEYAVGWDADIPDKVTAEDANAFYGIWADELLRSTVQTVMWHYHQEGRGDYFRVLHSKVCDRLSNAEIAALLEIKLTDVENYFRHARKTLTEHLEKAIVREVDRYSTGDSAEDFRQEWSELAKYFDSYGGLEEAVRHAAAEPQANQ